MYFEYPENAWSVIRMERDAHEIEYVYLETTPGSPTPREWRDHNIWRVG